MRVWRVRPERRLLTRGTHLMSDYGGVNRAQKNRQISPRLFFVEHHNVVNVLAFRILTAPRGRPGLSVCGHFRRNRHHYLPIFLLHSTTSKFVVPGDASAACQHWLDQTESTAQILGATPVPGVWLSRVDSGSFAILYHFRAIPSDGLGTSAGFP
jgi:hypothetical protein